MPLSLFMFPRSRRSEPRVPTGTFSVVPSVSGNQAPKSAPPREIPTKSDVAPKPAAAAAPAAAREDRKSDASWEAAGAEVYRITLPPDAPDGEVFPDIATALLAAADQLQRTPSQPELPKIADLHRRTKC